MPPIQPRPGIGRYIVRSDNPDQLAEFVQDVDKDPEIELVDTIGPANRWHTVVVSMSHEKASALEQRFRSSSKQLNIEPDRPLSLFGNAFGG